jgi:hypothetical protein
MRQLNKKQKSLLDNWYDVNGHALLIGFDLQYIDSFDILDKLESINNFETLHQAINRYINDKISKDDNDI